ncbi:VPLPA-CTERM sorting domain-containing protein [Oceanicoccus sp. KOV_DT_Chl]|uniref:VPLPA-CTERM sorting domain-containing protein n=1 Tax=Oceanicoccus sp. KOV_DT_Chl TaxID=1904639 RepID=UPI00190E630E|nr:VPLPA-CTERM sorting domain-containing protein [Oceanicoccus sp. KOV_DT_Chl]
MKKLLLATAIAVTAAQANAAVFNVTGTLSGATNAQATIVFNPAAPALVGTFDDSDGSFSFSVEDYDMDIIIAPGLNALVELSAITVTGDGAGQIGGAATVDNCSGSFEAAVCPGVGTPPTSNTYTYSFDGSVGTITNDINGGFSGGGNTLTYSFETSEVPVPAAAWLFGSALVGLAGIGRKRK